MTATFQFKNFRDGECTAKPRYDTQWFSNKEKAVLRKGRGLQFRCQTPHQENKLTAWIMGAIIPNFNCSSIYILFFQLGCRNLNWNKYQTAYLTVKYPILTRAGVQRSAFAKYREFIAGPARPMRLNWERKFVIKTKAQSERSSPEQQLPMLLLLKFHCPALYFAKAMLDAVIFSSFYFYQFIIFIKLSNFSIPGFSIWKVAAQLFRCMFRINSVN